MTDDSTEPEDISEETMMLVARVRHRAGEAPSVSHITALALEAVGQPGADLSAAEIRQVAAAALNQAQQVSFLLGKLAGLTGEPQDNGGDEP